MTKHARLAPSAAHRWFICPGSIRLSRGLAEQSSSRFADEGSAAHLLAARCLKTSVAVESFAGFHVDVDKELIVAKPGGDRVFPIDDEMVQGVRVYLDHCHNLLRPDVDREVEQFVSLEYLGVEGLDGGTTDFLAYDPVSQTLEIVDLKYGRGVAVEVPENKQLLSYALGAARRYHNRGLKHVTMTVVQPRCPHPSGSVRSWTIEVTSLLEFENDLTVAARLTQSDEAPLVPGPHCRWCPARAVCLTRQDHAFEIARAEFSGSGAMKLPAVTSLTPSEISKTLSLIDQLESWAKDFREHAFATARQGIAIPGWKLVQKRAVRKWRDTDATIKALIQKGLSLLDMEEEPQLKSPAQLEKLMPGRNQKEKAAQIEELVTKVSSGVTLAPDSDPRPSVDPDPVAAFS